MDLRAWTGFLLIAVYLSGAYFRVRRERRSGRTTSLGHPVLDNALLLASGLILAATLALALSLLKGDHPHPVKGRVIAYTLLIFVGGALTWLCNGILRRSRKS